MPGRIERLARRAAAVARVWSGPGAAERGRALLAFQRHHREASSLLRLLRHHRFVSGLLVAHRAGLFEALEEPISIGDLAARISFDPRPTELLVRALEGFGLLLVERSGPTPAQAAHSGVAGDERGDATAIVRLTPFAREFVTRDGVASMAAMLDLSAAFAASFPRLAEGAATGRIPPELDIFSPEADLDAFLGAVNAYLDVAVRELVARTDLPPVRSLIAGSMGVSFSANLLRRFPEATVTIGCLQHLIARIDPLIDRYHLDRARIEGIHAHGGDPESDRWGHERYDLVFLTKKMILEPDRRLGERFARKALAVLNHGGAAIFWESLHPDGAPSPRPRAADAILDLAASPWGPVLTEDGVRRTLRDVGFARVEIVPVLRGETRFVLAWK